MARNFRLFQRMLKASSRYYSTPPPEIVLVGLCRHQSVPCGLDKFLERQENRGIRRKFLIVIYRLVYAMVRLTSERVLYALLVTNRSRTARSLDRHHYDLHRMAAMECNQAEDENGKIRAKAKVP